jgi:preprotein translocase subunit SecG
MALFIFLTVVQAIVAALLVGVVLVQKSEGGGLGVGGSPTGFMSARGAVDFLTRATAVLATIFVVLSIVLAALAVRASGGGTIDTSLNRSVPQPVAPADPLGSAAQPGTQQPGALKSAPAASPAAPQAPAPVNNDPLSGAAKQ